MRPLQDENRKTANRKRCLGKEAYSVVFLSSVQFGEKNPNPNHLFMLTNSNHIVFALVVTKEEVKQQK